MKNLFNSWKNYNDNFGKDLPEAVANRWSKLMSESSQHWGSQSYPVGEDWKYVNYNQLADSDFNWTTSDSLDRLQTTDDCYLLEIKNFSGHGALEMSSLPAGLHIHNRLDEVKNNENSPLLNLYEKSDKDNLFAQSALSFADAGLVVRLDSGFKLDRPLKIVLDLNKVEQKDALAVFNVFVDCAESAHLPLFLELKGQEFSGLFNLRMDFALAQESHCSFYAKELGGEESHIVSSLQVDVRQGATFESFDFTLPGQWSRHNLRVDLRQEEASCNLRGGYLNNKNYFSDHHTEMNHWVGSTYSDEDYRGILSDTAKAVFNGKVFIEKKAAKSNSNQINKNLMLSKKADINTKPELKIFNDDVKAAHGATVGQLDNEQRFYLQSRGYTNTQALNILLKAFVFDLIESEDPYVKGFYAKDLEQAIALLKED